MNNKIALSMPSNDEVEDHLVEIVLALTANPDLNECMKPADAYELSGEITVEREGNFEMPEELLPQHFEDPAVQMKRAKACLLCFDPVAALTIVNSLWSDPNLHTYPGVQTVAHVAQGILDLRHDIRVAQVEGNWVQVINLLVLVEGQLLYPPPLKKPRNTFHGYTLPKGWYFWGLEAYIYLGKTQAAEFILNELAIKYELEPAERLWVQAQLGYANGDVRLALGLLQDLLVYNNEPLTRLLITRVTLIDRLFHYITKCDLSTDKGRKVFQTTAGKFFHFTQSSGYDRAVRGTIATPLAGPVRRCDTPPFQSVPRGWISKFRERAPKLLKKVKSSSKIALERSLAEMQALD